MPTFRTKKTMQHSENLAIELVPLEAQEARSPAEGGGKWEQRLPGLVRLLRGPRYCLFFDQPNGADAPTERKES